MEVGDQYVEFTTSEFIQHAGGEADTGLDGLMADIFGSGHGDKLVYCEDCTRRSDNGWMLNTVYGDEGDDA
jgi:hypothetical protein